jgi:hypothetical protein
MQNSMGSLTQRTQRGENFKTPNFTRGGGAKGPERDADAKGGLAEIANSKQPRSDAERSGIFEF